MKLGRTVVTGIATLALVAGSAWAMKYPKSKPLPEFAQQRAQVAQAQRPAAASRPANPVTPQAAPTPTRPIVEDVRPIIESGQTRVQIAILLDNSGSMSGLIEQTKSELWKVVNEFISAKVNGKAPLLEVALFTYGNPPPKLVVPLTEDLDRVSEELFKVTIRGGSEYCGMVIDEAVKQLSWAEGGDHLKLIFIAGNEPFTQGPVHYKESCSAAIAKGIIVNTIHCGNGIPADWRDGAVIADGKPMNINHNAQVVHVDAPQDAELAKLSAEINKTYVPYGRRGQAGLARQEAQDDNAAKVAPGAAIGRAITKGSAFYKNDAWDLVDAVNNGKVDLDDVEKDALPEQLKGMSNEECMKYIKAQTARRAELQKKILELNDARKKYVAAKMKERAEASGEKTLDAALIGAIRDQATKKGFELK